MKKYGLDVPSGATVLRFDTYGKAIAFERTIRSIGYLRPAHGRHLQGLSPGKYVLFDHDNAYWVGYMGRPQKPVHSHRLEPYKRGKRIGSNFYRYKVFKRTPVRGELFHRCVDCQKFMSVLEYQKSEVSM